jgi:hypothetical protein
MADIKQLAMGQSHEPAENHRPKQESKPMTKLLDSFI